MQRKLDAQQLQLETVLTEPVPGQAPRPLGSKGNVRAIHADRVSRGDDERLPARRSVSRPSAAELLETPGALLTRSHLRGLGLERRAIDAVFRALPVVALPGYSRPMIRAEEFLELVDGCTYRDDRVRPCHA